MTGSIDYQVVMDLGRVEIRKYPFIILAMVRDRQDDRAFSILFDYISGNNDGGERVPMTAPVVSTRAGARIEMTAPIIDDQDTFSFVLPAHLDLATAPRPKDRRIELVPVPSRHLAVLRFTGRTYDREVMIWERELLAVLKDRGIEATGTPFLMRYNSPFTPGFLRRNEVGVEIDPRSLHRGTE
jgi:hypothetical protein